MGSRYAETGVDVHKRGIESFKKTVKSIFPHAFCTVAKDPELRGYGILLHADGAGSKPVQSYLHWRETGELKWFEGIAQDVVAMNLDDLICVGAAPLAFVDYISLNPFRVPKVDLLKSLSSGFGECFGMLKKWGVEVPFLGGETADLPDQLETLDVSGTVSGRVKLSEVITGDNISPGDVIVGLRSGGKSRCEKTPNSGLMCNGITLARRCLMKKEYGERYPETVGLGAKGYYGKFAVDDHLDELEMTVGDAILSSTRVFAPLTKKILEKCGPSITGLIHNTGGGQTKCLKVGKNIRYVKDNLIDPDPIFMLIQRESGESWRSMFQDFNMGIGFEIITKKESVEDILDEAEKFDIGAKIIGRCERGKRGNQVKIASKFGKFEYR